MLRMLHQKRKRKNSEKNFNLVTVFKTKDGMGLPPSPIDIILTISGLVWVFTRIASKYFNWACKYCWVSTKAIFKSHLYITNLHLSQIEVFIISLCIFILCLSVLSFPDLQIGGPNEIYLTGQPQGLDTGKDQFTRTRKLGLGYSTDLINVDS